MATSSPNLYDGGLDNCILLILLAVKLLVGALIGNNSNASLFEVSLINTLSELTTDSVLLPNGLPCHAGLSSISGKDLPLKVLAKMHDGCPLTCEVLSRAATKAATSWPSTTCVFQPKDSNRLR